jgi:hypothetical protein
MGTEVSFGMPHTFETRKGVRVEATVAQAQTCGTGRETELGRLMRKRPVLATCARVRWAGRPIAKGH